MICTQCDRDLPRSRFYDRQNGKRQPCKICYSERERKRYHDNKPDPTSRTASLALKVRKPDEPVVVTTKRALTIQFRKEPDEAYLQKMAEVVRVMIAKAISPFDSRG